MAACGKCGRVRSGPHDPGMPQPTIDALPIGHKAQRLAALLGVGLELGLEGGELGKGRIRIGLLVALPPRQVFAPAFLLVTILVAILAKSWPLAAFARRPRGPCRSLSLLLRAAGAALTGFIAADFAGRAVTPAPVMAFGAGLGIDAGFRRGSRRFASARRGIAVGRLIRRLIRQSLIRRLGRRLIGQWGRCGTSLRLPGALAMVATRRAALGAPLFAAAAGTPDLDEFRLAGRDRRLRRGTISGGGRFRRLRVLPARWSRRRAQRLRRS